MKPRLFFIFLLALLCLNPIVAEGRRTGYRTTAYPKMSVDKRRQERKNPADALKEKELSGKTITSGDTAQFGYAASIEIRDYDKKANSNRESLFIRNRGERTIRMCRIEVRYLSMSGELLHSRQLDLKAEIKPGASKKFDVPTWDPQHSYRYHGSPLPRQTRNSIATTPYRIKTEVIAFQF